METLFDRKSRWNSLPTVFSQSHIASSIYRDSSCTSDDVSDTSVATAITAVTNISSTLPEIGIPIPQTPKLSFKQSLLAAEANLDGFESGYESDTSASEFAEHVEFSDFVDNAPHDPFQDDDIFDCELSSVASEHDDVEQLPDTSGDGDDYEMIDLDDSHITFENSVRFDSNVCYIDSPEYSGDSDNEDRGEPEPTLHELMETGGNKIQWKVIDESFYDDSGFFGESDIDIANCLVEDISARPEDYPRDMIELDKQLFIAYMNGMHAVAGPKYKSLLHDRLQGLRDGRVQSPFFESDSFQGGYLDEILKHVIGIFRNVVLRDEYDELVRLSAAKVAQRRGSSQKSLDTLSSDVLNKIETFLTERLAEGKVNFGKDELVFLAGGVAFALEHPNIYAYDQDVTESRNLQGLTEAAKA